MKFSLLELRSRLRDWWWVWAGTRGFRASLVTLSVAGAVVSVFGVAFAALTRLLIDRASHAEAGSLIVPLAGLAALVVFQIAAQAALNVFSSRLNKRVENRLREKVFASLQAASWQELHRRHSGDWVTRLTSDVTCMAGGITEVLPDMIALSVRFTAAFAYLTYLDPVMGGIALAAGVLFVLPGRFFAGRLCQLSGETRDCEGRIRSFLQEALRRNTVIKAFGAEAHFSRLLTVLHGESLRLTNRQAWVSTVPGAGLGLGYWLGYLMALTAGVFRLHAGQATFGMLTAFLQLIGQVQGPFQGLTRSFSRLISMHASLKRLMQVERLPSDLHEAATTHRAGKPDGAAAAVDSGVDLEFRGVSYAYEQTPVLDGVTFTVRAGEKVALAGDSGEGKTTIMRLLLGLIEPGAGEVRIRENRGGGNTHRPSRSARRFFAYVPQGNSLVSGTVGENILLGRLDRPGPADLKMVQHWAGAEQLLTELPGGFEARVLENGDGLSEGQAQRIALMRALVREAPVLLLDEATSSLDLRAEESVLSFIQGLGRNRTVLLVSHRAEVLAACDRILRLDDGKIVEEEPARGNIK